jgi:hypothetical protein
MPEGTTTTTTTTGDKPWFEGADADFTTLATTKGWDKLSAKDAAIQAVKSYQGVQSLIGAPPDKIIRLPDNLSDGAAMKPVWQKLGAPPDAKGYDFSVLKNPDGTPLDPKFTENVANMAAAANLTKDAALTLASSLQKQQLETKSAETTEKAAKLATETADLQKNWGPNFEINKFVASQAAKALGVDPAAVAALEGQIGYAKVMEMFRNIGAKIGEDRFVTNGNTAQPGTMTKDQAIQRKSDLMKDQAWVTKYLAGDTAANKEMLNINMLIVSQAA